MKATLKTLQDGVEKNYDIEYSQNPQVNVSYKDINAGDKDIKVATSYDWSPLQLDKSIDFQGRLNECEIVSEQMSFKLNNVNINDSEIIFHHCELINQ